MNPTLIFVALVAIFGAAHLAPVGNNDQNGQNGQNGISLTLQQLEVVAGQQFALLNVEQRKVRLFSTLDSLRISLLIKLPSNWVR